MKKPSCIDELSRRKLRYVLFQAKRLADEGGERLSAKDIQLTDEQVEAIEKYYLSKEFKAKDFSVLWDIGIDDIETMVNRREKYWLFGISRFVKVKRPIEKVTLLIGDKLVDHDKAWIDDVREGERFFVREGFAKELGGGSRRIVIDYEKILEQVDNRQTWLERG